MDQTQKISWDKILFFCTIAFVISGFFNSGYLEPAYKNFTAGYLISNWSFLPAGIGTLIAALLAFRFDGNLKRTISLLGNDPLRNIVISLVPIIVFTLLGIHNENPINKNIYALEITAIAIVYAITEEIFWRGYLLDVLRPIGRNLSSLLIGFIWWLWHLRFNTSFDFSWFLLICIASSFVLCKFANDTKSYMTSAALHALIIISTGMGNMDQTKIIGIAICLFIWLIISKYWKARKVVGNEKVLNLSQHYDKVKEQYEEVLKKLAE